jgi:LacI family transcriptional regulator, galactose operon repressor
MKDKNTSRRAPTIDDVARLAGVSSATVSRAINHSAPVIPETLQKVQDAIDALNYRPSAAARILAQRKTDTIGLLVPEISESFFLPLLRGIEQAASQAGYSLLIHTTSYGPKNNPVATLGEHNTDGLLVFSESMSNDELARLRQVRFPLVLIHQDAPPALDIPSITIENKQGTKVLVDHLIETHGRQRIVHLRGPQAANDALWREKGYRQSLAEHDIPYDPDLVLPGNFDTDTAQNAIRQLIQHGTAFDAVFSGDDSSALGVLAALREAGIRVPEDVSVVGFDDVDFASHVHPALTTIHAPTEQVGEKAVGQLLKLIAGEAVEPVTLLPVELVIRKSCGCE